MKNTTKKILLWLYPSSVDEERIVDVEELRLILPELKNSGFRSLLNLLKKQQLVLGEETSGQTRYRLTSYGMSSLEAHFPSFSQSMSHWSGQWSMIVFLNAPKSDKQFRYLRKFLVDKHCGQLSRGVYLYPGALTTEINDLLMKLYIGSVLVTGVEGWVFGDERSIIVDTFQLKDLKSGYSGIGKEIYQLLKKKNTKKSFEGRDKDEISLVFDRLVSFLDFDLGLLQYYYPEVRSGGEQLFRLRELI